MRKSLTGPRWPWPRPVGLGHLGGPFFGLSLASFVTGLIEAGWGPMGPPGPSGEGGGLEGGRGACREGARRPGRAPGPDGAVAGGEGEGNALLQGLVVCGRCGERMTIRYYVHHGQVVPEYLCQKRGIEKAEPPCQRLLGKDIDRAIGDLLVGTVTPLALEMALTVHDELVTEPPKPTTCATRQVDRARYEAELAQRRYLAVDPDNRPVGPVARSRTGPQAACAARRPR